MITFAVFGFLRIIHGHVHRSWKYCQQICLFLTVWPYFLFCPACLYMYMLMSRPRSISHYLDTMINARVWKWHRYFTITMWLLVLGFKCIRCYNTTSTWECILCRLLSNMCLHIHTAGTLHPFLHSHYNDTNIFHYNDSFQIYVKLGHQRM